MKNITDVLTKGLSRELMHNSSNGKSVMIVTIPS